MALQDDMKRKIKQQGKSDKTFETYWSWCNKYFRFLKDEYGDWKHPKECGRHDIELQFV